MEFLGLSECGNPALKWLPAIGLLHSHEADLLEEKWTKRSQEFIDFVVNGLREQLAEEAEAQRQAHVAAELQVEEPVQEPSSAEYISLAERAAELLGVDVKSYVRELVMRQAAHDIELLERVSGPRRFRR